jgi:hypothetical protein
MQRNVFGGWRRTTEAVLEATELLPCPSQDYFDVTRHIGSAPGTPGSPEARPALQLEPEVKSVKHVGFEF